MRKLFLAFLVLLAAAALGFAQDAAGTVTWSGETRMGAEADFSKEDPQLYPFSDRYGFVQFNYNQGPFHGAVRAYAEYPDDGVITGYVRALGEYGDGINGDTATPYKVNANVRFLNANGDTFDFANLYGYYLFLDRQLKLDLAYKGYETIYWRVSDIVASAWDNLDGKIGMALRFTPSAVNGLSAGIAYSNIGDKVIERLRKKDVALFEDVLMSTIIGAKYDVSPIAVSFMIQLDHDRHEMVWYEDSNGNKEYDGPTTSGGTPTQGETAYYSEGGAFRANLGFKYQISDVLHAQTDWQLALTPKAKDWIETEPAIALYEENYAYLRGGAKVEYNSAPLHAGLTIKLNEGGDFNQLTKLNTDHGGIMFDSDAAKLVDFYFQITPYVYYDLITDTLQFRLPIALGMDIAPETDGHKSGSGNGLTIAPALYWNLAGTGVTDDPGRGILVDYKIGLAFDEDYTKSHDDRGDFINKLGIRFRWNF
jgi:hypothetical protein